MRFQRLSEWLHWQEGLHPREIDLGLERVVSVYQAMQLDFSATTVITIAGTNGKGSCAALLSSILSHAGFKVGCYSSPHLLRYNERIQINGIMVDDDSLVRQFDIIDRARDNISLTYFEFATLAALACFLEQHCDIVVLEVGLGGRLDAVNILDADVALITSIDLDHCDWLGETREQIALEKAGILRAKSPFVCADRNPPASLLEKARQLDVNSYYSQRDFRWRLGSGEKSDKNAVTLAKTWDWEDENSQLPALPLPNLAGEFQLENAAAVLKCLRVIPQQSSISRQDIEFGLLHYTVPGRLQTIGHAPRRLLDVAHNPQSASALADYLGQIRDEGQIIGVFSCLDRKDVTGIIAALLPVIDDWYIAPLQNGNGVPMAKMQAAFREFGRVATECENVVAAWQRAVAESKADDTIIGFGSFFTVAEILTAREN